MLVALDQSLSQMTFNVIIILTLMIFFGCSCGAEVEVSPPMEPCTTEEALSRVKDEGVLCCCAPRPLERMLQATQHLSCTS